MAQYTVGNADNDGSTITIPGDVTGASEDSYKVDDAANSKSFDWYIHINNGWDVAIDVTVEGSHYQDSTLANAVSDGATETVSATSIDFFTGTTGHAFIGLMVEPLADPTSGDLTVTFQRRES